MPQAAGAGYGFRIKNEDKISVTYFGEGAASEGDFHSALNFAATLRCQTLFICRNNKYAISTPASKKLKCKLIFRYKDYHDVFLLELCVHKRYRIDIKPLQQQLKSV